MNYNNRTFKPLQVTSNGEVDSHTVFTYVQNGNVLSCSYQGSNIIEGHLLGTVDENGCIQMSYHQINSKGVIQTGICSSIPKVNKDGILELHEKWQWTNGDLSKGESVLIEVPS